MIIDKRFVSIILCFTFLLIVIYIYERKINAIERELKSKKSSFNEKKSLVNAAQIKYNFAKLDTFNLSIQTSVNEKKSINDLLIDGDKIVFFFTEQDCDLCAIKELKKLKAFADDGAMKERLLVLGNFSQFDHISYFKIKNSLDIEILNVNKIRLVPNLITPYFFYLDKDCLAKDLYIPSKKSLEDLTQTYFQTIINKYSVLSLSTNDD